MLKSRALNIGVAAVMPAGCGGPQPPIGAPAGLQWLPAPRSAQAGLPRARMRRQTAGLGWDIDQTGTDGVLSETMSDSSGLLNAIDTFDESSGKITTIVQKTQTNDDGPSPVVEAIAGDDIGLIDDQHNFVMSGKLVRDDKYLAMKPVTRNKITGTWTPSHATGLDPNFVTDNQESSSQAMVAYRLTEAGSEQAFLYMYDVATNAWQKPYLFPAHNVLSENTEYVAIDTQNNVAAASYQQYRYPFQS